MIKNNKQGQSILEVIIAMAIFALISTTIVSMVLGSFNILIRSEEMIEANLFAQEGIESVRAVKDRYWNKLIYSQSATTLSGGEWDFAGEGTVEQIGKFTRRINIYPVYRNNLNEIVASTTVDSYNDEHSKEIKVSVSWEIMNSSIKTIKRSTYLTNWRSAEWSQNDWSGGEGQSIWSDETMFSTSTNLDFGVGNIKLTEISTSTYALSGELVSSAFQIDRASNFNIIEWEETIPDLCDDCEIKFKIKTAIDDAGSPGAWSETWSGPEGEDGDESDFYATSTGQMIHTDHVGDEWIMYKAIFEGETDKTPELNEVKINYKK